MSSPELLHPFLSQLEHQPAWRWRGRVNKVLGYLVESEGPVCSLGESSEIVGANGRRHLAEVVGFRGNTVLSMLLDQPGGIRYGDCIMSRGGRPGLLVGEDMLGRVIDGMGKPLDGRGNFRAQQRWSLERPFASPLDRTPIRDPLGCGIRAIDAFITCGRGQRLGIFGGSGVGKTTLIGMMAKGSAADLTVLALVGERGREVRDFLEESLGPEGIRRSVVVVSTSDQSPLRRIRAAQTASAISEYFCSQGKHVLLVVDSLTRIAMAQREIGLAAGEPPTAKGYTPSVFSLLARLIERAGHFGVGSITAFFTVLMEGDDQQDTLVDAARALLDGHIVLDRRLSAQGHYPAISVLDSLSRLMPALCSPEHMNKAQRLRHLLAVYLRSEDLIRIGAYQRGSDPELEQALAVLGPLTAFLRQKKVEVAAFEQTRSALLALAC